MVAFKKFTNILFASILAAVLFVVIGINTTIFRSGGEFEYFMYISSYVFVAGIWALIALDMKVSKKLHTIISIVVCAMTPFFCMQISMILSGDAEFSFGIYFINVMFYVVIMAVTLAVTRSMRWSAIITVMLAYGFNLAIFIVNIMRGTPLMPIDFLAVGTAVHVVENYTFEIRYPIIVATIIAILIVSLIARFSFKLTFKKKNTVLPLAGAAVAIVFMICLSFVDYSEIKMDFYDQYHANNTHGSMYSFYINVRKMMIKKPEGYDVKHVTELLNSMPEEEIKPVCEMPNIIAIMNESFSDLSVVGELKTEREYMPYINSMKENTIKGELLVSPFGGNTCNTEYEFLTGLSMGMLPSGSTPYMQYVTGPYALALPYHLSDLGYKTVAIHPYYGRCWGRDKVYEMFGFDKFINLDNYSEYVPEDEWRYVRNYLSDETSYAAIISQLEQKKKDERVFVFNVTIQNHGGYTYNEGFEGLDITNLKGEYKEAEQYLELVRESDSAFEELINYLKASDEPTIVVMFGDHQPAVEQEFFEELYGKSLTKVTLEELQQRYKIPFVIWANYDIDEKYDVKTSPNYLSNLLLDKANVPKNRLGMFTKEVSASIPQLNAMGHYDAGGYWFENDTSTSKELRDYEMVEYYIISR